MAGLIPRDFIEDLVARTDIVEVVGSRVQLKKSGREYAACCPFHGEKTPSFYVSPQKQFYHCFGCGAHGNALGFLIEYEHMEFVEAVEELARVAGVDVPREGGDAPRRERGSPDLYAVLEDAARFYRQQLKAAPDAVEYLKKRGLTGEIAVEFGIGWAPSGWDALLGALGGDEARRELLERAGLVTRRDDRVYDRFRARVMFPIRDARGRTIGFGGRVLDASEPKYLNSPETPVFHKGQELYGLYEAKQALRDIPRLLVVEGYMDVVALAQHGVRNAVATLGTSTTADHLQKLFRITPEVVFCFDGDRAGRAAAWRALEQALPECRDGRQIRFLFLPEGEDPDTMVRAEGAERFGDRVDAARPLSGFLLDHLAEDLDLSVPEGRARLAELARPLIAKVPAGVFRDLLVEGLADRSRVNPQSLTKLIGKGEAAARPPGRRARPRVPLQMTPVRKAVQYLLHWPALAGEVADPDAVAALDQPGAALLGELAGWFHEHPAATAAVALEHWRGTEHEPALARLVETDPLVGPDEARAEFRALLGRIAGQSDQTRAARRLEELIAKSPGLNDAEKAELRLLLQAKNSTETGA